MITWAMRLSAEAYPIWVSGGWWMVGLAINGLVIFGLGWTLLFGLMHRGAMASPDRAWRNRAQAPGRARRPLDRMLAAAMQCQNLETQKRYFESLHVAEARPFARDLKVMQVAVSLAPLLGLLGTVTGMLTTFKALAAGGGEKTMGMIASGISEALITTETGLVLALSGVIFQYSLARLHERFNKTLAHFETLCAQEIHQESTAARAA
jgi:biopolymer transport protein ExbB